MLQPLELTLHLPMILSNGVRSSTDKVWSILKASYEGQLEKVKTLVSECRELIFAQYNYTPPIHFAVREGHVELVKFLLNNRAEINPIDEEYQSIPLGMAARWGHLDMVNYLLKQGADPNKSGAAWSRPLVWAKNKRHEEVEQALLRAGAT